MKKLIAWMLGVISVLSLSTGIFAEETIRLTTGEWPPFISKDLKYDGVVMRIVKESFAMEGIHVNYEFFPWGRAEDLVKQGYWDGLAVQTESPDYLNSDVVAEDRLVFFHLKENQFDWSKVEDLEGIMIGGIIANTYGETLTKMEKAGKIFISRVITEEQNFKKMLWGRIEISPIGLTFGYSILNKHFNNQQIERITYHPKPIRTSYYRLSLSKKIERNKRMLQLFNKGLNRLKASGKYEQYFEESRRGEYNIKK